MATPQGQDVIRCQLCPNSVEHHCNRCHVDLCFHCVSRHLTDRSKRHEVVDFINKKVELILPECKSHNKTPCEMYCNDCLEPTCVMCVTTAHKKHDISNIKSIVENLKRRIAADVEELENIILPKYKKDFGVGKSSIEFDKVMNAIQDQEENICKVVREIGSQLKDEVAKQKRKFEQKNKELQSSIAKEEKELDTVIKNNKGIFESNNSKRILTYQSKNEQFRKGPEQMQMSYPMFFTGKIRQNQLLRMFGSLQSTNFIAPVRELGTKKLMSNPVILSAIQTPYSKYTCLWRVLCEETGEIWVSGDDSKIYKLDQRGLVLKTVFVSEDVNALTLDMDKQLFFSIGWSDTKVYRYDGNVVRTAVDLGQWCPRGLCHSADGDLLVSMRFKDETQSRVVRYSGIKSTMIIQNDRQGKRLFSNGDAAVLQLTENGNRDICVSDYAGKAVVVVNASGELRFKYQGKTSQKRNYKSFKPTKIATDVNQQILINDVSKDIVHVIDSDGNFLRFIEYSCRGGLSIDREHNLVVGDINNGRLRIIKYLQ